MLKIVYPKQTYESQITEEMAIRYLQTLGNQNTQYA
jgi:hypothetical protein